MGLNIDAAKIRAAMLSKPGWTTEPTGAARVLPFHVWQRGVAVQYARLKGVTLEGPEIPEMVRAWTHRQHHRTKRLAGALARYIVWVEEVGCVTQTQDEHLLHHLWACGVPAPTLRQLRGRRVIAHDTLVWCAASDSPKHVRKRVRIAIKLRRAHLRAGEYSLRDATRLAKLSTRFLRWVRVQPELSPDGTPVRTLSVCALGVGGSRTARVDWAGIAQAHRRWVSIPQDVYRRHRMAAPTWQDVGSLVGMHDMLRETSGPRTADLFRRMQVADGPGRPGFPDHIHTVLVVLDRARNAERPDRVQRAYEALVGLVGVDGYTRLGEVTMAALWSYHTEAAARRLEMFQLLGSVEQRLETCAEQMRALANQLWRLEQAAAIPDEVARARLNLPYGGLQRMQQFADELAPVQDLATYDHAVSELLAARPSDATMSSRDARQTWGADLLPDAKRTTHNVDQGDNVDSGDHGANGVPPALWRGIELD